MRLLNTLRLLTRATPPTSGVATGAVYYDTTEAEPRYHNGDRWRAFHLQGVPNPNRGEFYIPVDRQVLYFDQLVNDGVLTIEGTLVGIR